MAKDKLDDLPQAAEEYFNSKKVEFSPPEPVTTMCVLCGEQMTDEELREPKVICPDCKRPMHRRHVVAMKEAGIEGCFYCKNVKLSDKSDKEHFEQLRKDLEKKEKKKSFLHTSKVTNQIFPNSLATNTPMYISTARTDRQIQPGEVISVDLNNAEIYPYRDNPDVMGRMVGWGGNSMEVDKFEIDKNLGKFFSSSAVDKLKEKTEHIRVEIPPYRRTGRTTELVERAIDHIDRMKELKFDTRVLFLSDNKQMANVGRDYAIEKLSKQRDRTGEVMDRITFVGLNEAKRFTRGRTYSMCIADMNTNITPQHETLISKICAPVMTTYTTHIMYNEEIERTFDIEIKREFRTDRNWITYECILKEKPDYSAIARMKSHNQELKELKKVEKHEKWIKRIITAIAIVGGISLFFLVG